jgi:hypothetical protein
MRKRSTLHKRKRSTKHSRKRKTLHKRSTKYNKKRSTHKKQRGGRDFQAGATREVIERVPITDKVTIATTDGWVGTAQSYKAHEEYLSNQLRVTGSG